MVDQLHGRRVDIVTVRRQKITGHITRGLNSDGTFLVRNLADDGTGVEVLLADVVTMRPARGTQ